MIYVIVGVQVPSPLLKRSSGGMVDAVDLKSILKILGTGSSPVRRRKKIRLASLMEKYPAFNRCDIGSNPMQT